MFNNTENLSNFLKYVTGSFQFQYLNYCKSYDSPLKFNLIFSSWWWCPCATTLTEFPLNFCDLGLVLMALYSILYCEFCDVVRWCKKIICKNCESGTSTTTNNNQSHSMSRIFVVIFLTKDALCVVVVSFSQLIFFILANHFRVLYELLKVREVCNEKKYIYIYVLLWVD